MQVANVELNGFRAVALAGVGDRNGQSHQTILSVLTIQTRLAQLEVRVAQAIAEGEERVVEVAIGASFHAVVLIIRQLRAVLIERHRQFSAWINVTKEHVCHCRTAFLARIPSLDDGIASLRLRFESDART